MKYYHLQYHAELKNGLRNCSQHFAKRWIYQLLHNCCEPLDIMMVAGNHYPKEMTKGSERYKSQIGSLNSTLSCLSLNESRRSTSVLSMTGVTFFLSLSEFLKIFIYN